MNDFCSANTKTTTNMQSENTNIPAFLGKLWKMVNDPSTDPLICWSSHGKSFVIQNQVQFWVELLPVYYKHNNMSSFVRQLNMYGFHKMSNVENATLDNMDKDEIQFYHPCFQRDRPELLKMIKRKATTRPHDQARTEPTKGDDLSQVLIDVEQLRTRQMNVDNQLSIMQGENASMFKELTLLRVKHLRQQQIVNKLIQFLVTLSTPASPRMGVSVKRRMPLMIHESPNKRFKNRKTSHSKDVGPTIHELEEEMGISPGLIGGNTVEEDIPLEALDTALTKDKIQSPLTPSSCSSTSSSIHKDTSPLPNPNINEQQEQDFVWDKPELANFTEQLNFPENDEDLLNSLQNNPSTDNKEIFLNVTGRDSLIGNLVDPIAYNSGAATTKSNNNQKKQTGNNKNYINAQQRNSLVAAGKESPQQIRIQNGSDLDSHLDNTQAELEQLKDILHGCESFDTNTVQGNFNIKNDDATTRRMAIDNNLPDTYLQLFTHCTDQDGNIIQNKDANGDPLLTGTALPESMIDFNELLSDTLTPDDELLHPAIITNQLRTTSGLDTL